MPSNITGRSGVNVYLNRDPIQGILPVLATQVSDTDPISISLKGITNFGGAHKILQINAANDAFIWAEALVVNPNIQLGTLGSGGTLQSYLYGSGTVSDSNYALSFHSNGTTVNLQARVDGGGLNSNINLYFANVRKFIFYSNLKMKVGDYTFTFPSTTGTLALTTDLPSVYWSNSVSGELRPASVYTTINLQATSSNVLLPNNTKIKPIGYDEINCIHYDTGNSGQIVFGENATGTSSGINTAIYTKQFIKFVGGSGEIMRMNAPPSGNKTITMYGDITSSYDASFNDVITDTIIGKTLKLNITDFATTAVNALIVDGDAIFSASSGRNDPLRIAMDNSSFNYQGLAYYNTKANAETGGGTGRLVYMESHKTTGSLEIRATDYVKIESNGGDQQITLNSTGFTGSHSAYNPSDDRVKFDEELIVNATDTLMKLRPQKYMRQFEMGSEEKREGTHYNLDRIKEAGLIAQEIYYETPELRHLVVSNSDGVKELEEDVNFEDIQNDIDYEELGWNPKVKAGVKYTEFVPYLVKSNQEQQEEINTLKAELNAIKELLAKDN